MRMTNHLTDLELIYMYHVFFCTIKAAIHPILFLNNSESTLTTLREYRKIVLQCVPRHLA